MKRRRLKYDPLYVHLVRQDAGRAACNSLSSKSNIIIGEKLPRSAYDYRTWWSNRWFELDNTPQVRAWREAGWQVLEVNLLRQTVEFKRMA